VFDRVERKQKRPQGHCDDAYALRGGKISIRRENKNARKGIATDLIQILSQVPGVQRENKNARKGIATGSDTPAQSHPPSPEKTKTPARALRLNDEHDTPFSAFVHERKQKRPQGHCDFSCSRLRCEPRTAERKQKRPQGHCDLRRGMLIGANKQRRENKNARKGIATFAVAAGYP